MNGRVAQSDRSEGAVRGWYDDWYLDSVFDDTRSDLGLLQQACGSPVHMGMGL